MTPITLMGPPAGPTQHGLARKRSRDHTDADDGDVSSQEKPNLTLHNNTRTGDDRVQSQSLDDQSRHQFDRSEMNDTGSGGSDELSENDSLEKAFQAYDNRDDDDVCPAIDAEDPQHELDHFDWRDLEKRYSSKMTQLNEREDDIFKDFRSLCAYFETWAEAGSMKEADRGAKRLKTQAWLVQHQENDLEKRRERYVRVINAFKNALEMLGD